MKHIERKFLNQFSETEFKKESEGQALEQYARGEDGEKLNKRKITKNSIAYLKTVSDLYIKGFSHKVDGKTYTFPEPDPTLIYFSNAQRFRREIKEFKKELLTKLDFCNSEIDGFTHDYYNYFGAVCGTIIFLFTSLESFMNSLIKESDIYKRELSNKTELYNFQQIQESISFGDKIKKVIPQLTSKDYFKAHPKKAQTIDSLKEFRDSIIHTKSTTDIIQHDIIVKRSFSFNYDQAIGVIAEYINFYKNDYVKECSCDSDF